MDHLKNDQIDLQIAREPHCRVKFTAQVAPSVVKEAQKEAVHEVTKGITLPGFRKGKAPEALILKSYKSQIEGQWDKTLADMAFRACEELANIPPLAGSNQIGFEMISKSLEEGAQVVFRFEAEPAIPAVDYAALALKAGEKAVIDDQKIDETVEQIRTFMAQWEYITDRGAQPGDFVRLDVDLLEGEAPTRAFTNTRFQITSDKMAQWMQELVVGMQVGESRDGISQADPDASEEDKKTFSPKKIRVHLISIEAQNLPPVDSAFAERLGVKSVEEMRERLSLLLNKQAVDLLKKEMRDQASEILLSTYHFDLPHSIIQREIEFRMKQKMSNAHFANKWRSMSDAEKEEERKNLAKDAENAIRLFYICRKIVEDEKIDFTEHKVEPATLLDALFTEQPALNSTQSDEERTIALSRLMLSKAQDFVIEKCLSLST